MSVDVKIKSKGLFKKELSFKDVVFDGMRYGVMDEAFRLEECVTGEYTVIFNDKSICRGYEISMKKGVVELRMSIPTSEDDIRFFYDYIAKICTLMKTRDFERNGEKAMLDCTDAYIAADIAGSKDALQDMEAKLMTGEYLTMHIFGAICPIAFGKEEFATVGSDIRKFGELMHRLQSMDIYYAVPRVYQREDGSLFGSFFLLENTDSAFPYVAKLFMPQPDMEVKDWYISFGIDNKIVGKMAYEDFIKEVDTSDRYDSERFFITLSADKIRELLSKYQID